MNTLKAPYMMSSKQWMTTQHVDRDWGLSAAIDHTINSYWRIDRYMLLKGEPPLVYIMDERISPTKSHKNVYSMPADKFDDGMMYWPILVTIFPAFSGIPLPQQDKGYDDSLWHSEVIWRHKCVNISSGIGLLPGGNKPLPEPMLT